MSTRRRDLENWQEDFKRKRVSYEEAAKVVTEAAQERAAARRRAMSYAHLAAAYELPPAIILMCGLPACGKTWAGERVAPFLTPVLGAHGRTLSFKQFDNGAVLIGGGYAISHFIDLGDVNTSFLFNIGAGAGAMIVKRDWPENRVKGIHLIADGMMSRHVIVPASGTVQHPSDEAVREGGFKFRLYVFPIPPRAQTVHFFDKKLGCFPGG